MKIFFYGKWGGKLGINLRVLMMTYSFDIFIHLLFLGLKMRVRIFAKFTDLKSERTLWSGLCEIFFYEGILF